PRAVTTCRPPWRCSRGPTSTWTSSSSTSGDLTPMTSDTIGAIYAVVVLIVDIVIRVLGVFFVPQNRKPQTAAAWLLAIFLIPYVGIILFLLIGNTRLPKSRRDKQREINEYILETTEGMDEVARDPDFPPWLDPIVELNRTLGSMPLVGGNTADLFTEYNESLKAMTEAIGRAKGYFHVEFYILALDKTTAPFFDALAAAVKRGVTVRVLMDHIACLRSPHFSRT